MSWVTILWSMIASVSFTLAVIYLLIWFRERRSWAYLCFFVLAVGVIGMAAGEFAAMYAKTPAAYGSAIRWGHFAYGFIAVGSLGFIHFYFGTGKRWLLGAALGLRLLAVVANFGTGLNLHIGSIQSLQQIHFLGEPVSMLGLWTMNPWVRLGQLAALVQLAYVVDASLRLWRTGDRESRRRAAIVGGPLAFFIVFASAQAGLVAAGVLRMPMIVSFPFLAVLLAMTYELGRDVHRAAQLGLELRESEQQMALATEAAKLGVWVRDLVRNEIWANENWRVLFGFDLTERLNLDKFLLRLHPEDRETFLAAVAKATHGNGHYYAEFRVVLPDGKTRWIVSRGRVEFNGGGKPVRVRGVSSDITVRKQAEAELWHSAEFKRAILDSVAAHIAVLNGEGVIVAVNARWQEFARESSARSGEPAPNTGMGTNYLEVCRHSFGDSAEVARAAHDGILAVLLGRMKNFTLEYACDSPQQRRWFLMTVTPLGSPGESVVVAHVDITDRKQTEEANRNSTELMAAIFNSIPGLLYLYTEDGRLVRWNRQHEVMTGYTAEELLNFRAEDWYDAEDRLTLARVFPKVFTEGYAEAEMKLIHKHGEKVPYALTGTKVIIDGKPYLVGIGINISGRKQAEAETARQRTELAHLSRVTMLGELSGSMAHELNQPLTAILSNAQAAQRFLAHENADLNEVRDILKDIVEQDNRAGEIIRRLRLLLKKGEVHHLPLDLNDVVQEVLKLMRSDLVNHSMTVHTLLGPDLPLVQGDRVQLQQVLLNLIMNACDAMSGNPPADRRLVVRTELSGNDGVCVSVSDDGTGIAPDKLEQIFEPFYTTKSHGLGLGLSVCRTIISAHGGKLWAAPGMESGAVFSFTIPVHTESPS